MLAGRGDSVITSPTHIDHIDPPISSLPNDRYYRVWTYRVDRINLQRLCDRLSVTRTELLHMMITETCNANGIQPMIHEPVKRE